jgi:hypothetical protein
MGTRIIKVSIDVKKIRKERLKVKDNATYLDMVLIETPGKKSDWMVVEDQTKEETATGKKSTILGNGKNFNWGSTNNNTEGGQSSQSANKPTLSADDMPF